MNKLLEQSLDQNRGRIEDMSASEARQEWERNRDTYNPDGMTSEQLVYRCRLQDMLYLRSVEGDVG